MAMLHNFLQEPKPNELAHSTVSALLVTNPGLLDWALFMAEATAMGAAKLVKATEKWGTTDSKTQTAFNLACNTDLPFFDYLAQTPDLRKKFAVYMENVTASEGTKIDHLVNGFHWASLGEATVVDVGLPTTASRIITSPACITVRAYVTLSALLGWRLQLPRLSRARNRVSPAPPGCPRPT